MQLQEDGKRKSILPKRMLTRKITEEEEEEDKIKLAELHTMDSTCWFPGKSPGLDLSHMQPNTWTLWLFAEQQIILHGIYDTSDTLHHKLCPLHSVFVLEVVNHVRGQSSACVFSGL